MVTENLSYISPFFIVSNLQSSLGFYKEKLGFEIQFSSPAENPFFAIIGRDNISIMLKGDLVNTKPIPNNTIQKWARWDAFISVIDPDSLFRELSENGVNFMQTLKEDEDGLYGFEVKDTDGYVLYFGRPK